MLFTEPNVIDLLQVFRGPCPEWVPRRPQPWPPRPPPCLCGSPRRPYPLIIRATCANSAARPSAEIITAETSTTGAFKIQNYSQNKMSRRWKIKLMANFVLCSFAGSISTVWTATRGYSWKRRRWSGTSSGTRSATSLCSTASCATRPWTTARTDSPTVNTTASRPTTTASRSEPTGWVHSMINYSE